MAKMKRSQKVAARKAAEAAAEANEAKVNATSDAEQESKEDDEVEPLVMPGLLCDDDDDDNENGDAIPAKIDGVDVVLSGKPLKKLLAMVQEGDQLTTRYWDQLNQAFGEEIAAFKIMERQEKKLDKLLDRLLEEEDPKMIAVLLAEVKKKREELEQLRADYMKKRDAARKLALSVADHSDRLNQELSTVSRWAFQTSKAEPGSRTRGKDNDKGKDKGKDEGKDESKDESKDNVKGNEPGSEGEDTTISGMDGDTVTNGQTGAPSSEGPKADDQSENQDGSPVGTNGATNGNGKPRNRTPKMDARELNNLTLAELIRQKLIPEDAIIPVKHELESEEFTCPNCGNKMVKDGYDHGWYTLEYQPARFIVYDHLVQVAVCKNCSEEREDGHRTIRKAKHEEKEKQLADKSYLTPSLAAFIAVTWIYYGVTKYRLQVMTAAMGFPMNSSVLGELLENLRCWITPMYELLKAESLKAPVLFIDETTWRTMQHLKGGERKESRVFAFVTDPKGGKSIRIYEYQPDREATHITDYLDGYQYIIVTDGYQGYEKVANVIHCICWAHYLLSNIIRDAA